jgi:fructokinase
MISRIGADPHGHHVISAMQKHGMVTTGIQKNSKYPTGRVHVALEDGQPRFDIEHPSAYDHITYSDLPVTAKTDILLYHGTLALRENESYQTWQTLSRRYPHSIFFDVNLRSPWWSADQLRGELAATHWLKLNDTEWEILFSDVLKTVATEPDAKILFGTYPELEGIFLTHGADGATLILRSGDTLCACPEPVDAIVDTVGAGDAFTAVCLYGLLNDWAPKTYLERAVHFAADICRQQGAIAENPSLYKKHIANWEV